MEIVDKKINFLGDSITEGVGASTIENVYVNVFARISGAEVRNYGISGTRIARQIGIPEEEWERVNRNFFTNRVDEMDADADIVVVFGGTNDFGHGDAEFGQLDSKDVYTFCGAVNTLFSKLVARYGKEKLCVILPLHRIDEDNVYGDGSKTKESKTLKEYVFALRTLAGKYGLDMMEFDKEFPYSQIAPGQGLTTDGLHPNSYGHKILAEKICEYIRNKIN